MLIFVVRRVLLMIPILLGVSLITFLIVRSIPGDPVQVLIGANQRTTPEQIENIRRSYGLDQPLPVQYVRWLGHVVQGDLGTSLRTRRTLTQELGLRLPVSIELAVLASAIAIIPALTVGVLAALRRNSLIDYLATLGNLLGVSVPNFLLATLLVLVFSYKLQWLPPIGYQPFFDAPFQNLKTMILPALSLGLPLSAILMRITRSSVLEVMGQDHVRTARAKGLTRRTVLTHHILPNAGIPIVTVGGIQMANILGGTVIVEQIFSLPGVGRYVFEAIANRDYPVVQGVTLVLATIFVLISLVVDLIYAFLDPRLRSS